MRSLETLDTLTTTSTSPAQRAWNAVRLPCWSRSIRVGFRPIAGFYLRGNSSFEVSYSFTDQVLAQLDFLRYWKVNEACKTDLSGLKAVSKVDTTVELYCPLECAVAGSPRLKESNPRQKGDDPKTDLCPGG